MHQLRLGNCKLFGQEIHGNCEVTEEQGVDKSVFSNARSRHVIPGVGRKLEAVSCEQGLYTLRMRFLEVQKDGGPRIIVP